MIEIVDLKKSYEIGPVLKGINFTVNDGDIISVIGGSGCGKSTFIRCINMLEKPSDGKIILDLDYARALACEMARNYEKQKGNEHGQSTSAESSP